MNYLQNKAIKGLLQGQLISLLIAGTGIFASILSSEGANFPTMMNFMNYALLSTILFRRTSFGRRLLTSFCCPYEIIVTESSHSLRQTTTSCDDEGDNVSRGFGCNRLARSTGGECTPRALLFWYIAGAILDVEANFLVTEAYNYTSITSIMLLDCFTIPCAMILSYTFLGCRYSRRHLLGVAFCLLGLACIVITDVLFSPNRQGTSTLVGDIMCLLGSGLYACSNVLEEYMVKYRDRWDYIGAIGGFGSAISFIQMMAIDYRKMRRAQFSPLAIGSTFGFVSCLFLMYINTSSFLQYGDSTLFNLSLLTSDVYAVTFSYFFTGTFVHWLYFIAFGLIACGLLLYHSAKEPIEQKLKQEQQQEEEQGEDVQIDEEAAALSLSPDTLVPVSVVGLVGLHLTSSSSSFKDESTVEQSDEQPAERRRTGLTNNTTGLTNNTTGLTNDNTTGLTNTTTPALLAGSTATATAAISTDKSKLRAVNSSGGENRLVRRTDDGSSNSSTYNPISSISSRLNDTSNNSQASKIGVDL